MILNDPKALAISCAASGFKISRWRPIQSFYKVTRSVLLQNVPIPRPPRRVLVNYTQCLPLLMRFTLSSLSLVSCCALFPCFGTLKVTWKYTRGWSTHSKIVRRSLECRHLLVHDLDRCRMSRAMHQLDRMEQEHGEQGSGLL